MTGGGNGCHACTNINAQHIQHVHTAWLVTGSFKTKLKRFIGANFPKLATALPERLIQSGAVGACPEHHDIVIHDVGTTDKVRRS